MAQNNNNLLVYTTKMDSLYIDISSYEYVLVFDIYSCNDCVSPKVKKKGKILLIPLNNDAIYENRLQTTLELKRDYPASDCYFLSSKEEKSNILLKYSKNQLIQIKLKGEKKRQNM
jgi:uncharacterized protein YuzE